MQRESFFENKGIEMQMSARNKYQAEKSFEYSCKCCTQKGFWKRCDQCGINRAHEERMKDFDRRSNLDLDKIIFTRVYTAKH